MEFLKNEPRTYEWIKMGKELCKQMAFQKMSGKNLFTCVIFDRTIIFCSLNPEQSG